MKTNEKFREKLLDQYPSMLQNDLKGILTYAISMMGDVTAIAPLITGYAADGRRFDSTLKFAISNVALAKRESVELRGAYDLYGVDRTAFRKKLFEMTDGSLGAEVGTLATACLDALDRVRDEYGLVDTEPRHPDLASGRPWPIIRDGLDQAVA